MPVGFFFCESCFSRELRSAIKVFEGSIDISDTGKAQRNIAKIVAGRRLKTQTYADLQGLPVIGQRFTKLSQQ